MKLLFSSLLVLFMTVSITHAQEWSENFTVIYLDKGIDEAVIMALSEGANPYQIINIALPLEGVEDVILLKALYCISWNQYCRCVQPVGIEKIAVHYHLGP